MFRNRSDATLVTNLSGFRRVMPYLLPSRTESQVFYTEQIEAEALQVWLAGRNGHPDGQPVSLLHAFLTALVRVVRLRPEVNRFVSGHRTYQHRDIRVTFVVKRELTDDAEVAEARVVFTGAESVEQTRDLVQAAIARARSGARSTDDRLVDFFSRWPRPLLRLVAWLIARLDHHNALPKPVLEAIPLFTSVYLAPLGSIGLDAPLHHLYRYGTASVFMAIGAIRPAPVVDADGRIVARDCVRVSYTLDERISDGYYLARSLDLFRRLIERPWLLDVPELTVDQILAAPRQPEG